MVKLGQTCISAYIVRSVAHNKFLPRNNFEHIIHSGRSIFVHQRQLVGGGTEHTECAGKVGATGEDFG